MTRPHPTGCHCRACKRELQERLDEAFERAEADARSSRRRRRAAMAKREQPWPRCGAPLKDGVCRSAVVTGENGEPGERCAFHTANAAPVSVEEPAPAEPAEVVEIVAVDEAPATVEKITSLRAALREGTATAEVAELMRELLLDGLRASRDVFVTCKNCKHRSPVLLPDLGTRMKAAVELIEQLEGKLATKEAEPWRELKALHDREMESLTDDELFLLIQEGRAASGLEAERHPKEEVLEIARRILDGESLPAGFNGCPDCRSYRLCAVHVEAARLAELAGAR